MPREFDSPTAAPGAMVRHPRVEVGFDAAAAPIPSPTLPELCARLRDRRMKVRIAAAEALGRLGDPAAVPALIAAFREPRWRPRPVHWIWVLVALSPFMLVGYFGGRPDLLLGAAYVGVGPVLLFLGSVHVQRGRAAWNRAVAEALAAIGERHPTAEVGSVVPRLRQAATDALTADRMDEWIACDTAANRIEAATRGSERLPVPAVAPGLASGALPRPAPALRAPAEELPRPAKEP